MPIVKHNPDSFELREEDLFNPVLQKLLFEYLDKAWQFAPLELFRTQGGDWYVAAGPVVYDRDIVSGFSWAKIDAHNNYAVMLRELKITVTDQVATPPPEQKHIKRTDIDAVIARDWWNHRRFKELEVGHGKA